MIYKKLNVQIQEKIDDIIKKRRKKKFKDGLLLDLLTFHIKNNIDFIKTYFIY